MDSSGSLSTFLWRGPVFMALLWTCLYGELVLWGIAPATALLSGPLVGLFVGFVAGSHLIDVSLRQRAACFLAGAGLGACLGLAYSLVMGSPPIYGQAACWGSILGPLLLPKLELRGGNLLDRFQGALFGGLAAGLIGLAVFYFHPELGKAGIFQLCLLGCGIGLLVPSRSDLFNDRTARMPGQALRGGLWGGLLGVVLMAMITACIYGSGLSIPPRDWKIFYWLPGVFVVIGAVVGILLNGTRFFRRLNRFYQDS